MTEHKVFDYIAYTVAIASLVYSFFPPVEAFEAYPRFQKVYQFFMIFVVKFASFNFRNIVIPEIKATSNQCGTDPK